MSLARCAALLAGLGLALAPVTAAPVGALPSAPVDVAAGSVVALAGTPHLWVAGDDGMLHWAGDTRALTGKKVDWGSRREVAVEELKSMPRGDPWLTAGLLKIGDPIYFVKWETGEAAPRLLHILSIRDVELFGINERNYGAMVLDQGTWEGRFGFRVADLVKGTLAAAVGAPPDGVIASDSFDNPAVGLLPKTSPAPTSYLQGYEGGEYFYRRTDPLSRAQLSYRFPGTLEEGSIAIDFRMTEDLAGGLLQLYCRRHGANEAEGPFVNFTPNNAQALLYRSGPYSVPATAPTLLGRSNGHPAVSRGTGWNRVELRCVGTTVSVHVNGTEVVAAEDARDQVAGRWFFQYIPPRDLTSEGRLDNLVLRMR